MLSWYAIEGEKKKKFHQSLFIAAMIILAIKNITDSSMILRKPDKLDDFMIILFIFLISIKILTQKYTFKSIILSAMFFFTCVFTCIKCHYFYLFFTSLLLCAMQEIDLKKVLSATSITKFVLLGYHVFCYIKDLIFFPWKVTYSYRLGGGPRMTFYQGHANTFAMYICWSSLEFLYAKNDKLKPGHIGFIWFINFIFYLCCDSNTSFIIITLACLNILAFKSLTERYKKIFEINIKFLSRYLYAVLSVFFTTVIIGFVNGFFSDIFKKLDNFFTGRLLYGAVAYDLKGMSWFGKTVEFPPKIHWRGYWIDSMIFDNCFIWMFISYGVIYLIMISFFFWKYAKEMETIDCIFLVLYTLYTIMEAYVMNCSICFSLLIVGMYIAKVQEKKRNEHLHKHYYPSLQY